ncbi:MAG: hypothetical protein HC764_26500 [Pleurocapsa sp. CRU_1_2]|nr:hypothetical protein [Pleurocapsa sp. CRU_1_2]
MNKAMNETKTEVVLRLDDKEYQTLNQYCLTNGFSLSEGAIYLIKEGQLLQEENNPVGITETGYKDRLFNERLKYMEKTLDRWITVFFRTVEGNERLGKRIAEIEVEIESLRKP